MANYHMLGGDGKEYGPVSTEQLRQWMAEKRANAKTQIRADKNSPWVALGTVPEFNVSAAGAGAGTGLATGPNPGNYVPGSPGESTQAVKRIALALGASGGSMRAVAILIFIFSGLFIVQTIGLGLVIAWLPIWLGIILNRAASRAKLAAATGSENDVNATLEHLRSFFKKSSSALLFALVLVIICLVLMSVVFSRMGDLLNVPGLSGR